MKNGDKTGYEDWNLEEIHIGDTCKYPNADWEDIVFFKDGAIYFECITLEEACMYPIYIVKRWNE